MSAKHHEKAIFRYDPDDRAWLVEAARDRRIHTYGRTVDAAHGAIREALAVWCDDDDVEPDDFEIEAVYEVPGTVKANLGELGELRELVERAEAEYRASLLLALKELEAANVSRRDSARLVGLSHQRVQQLLKADPPPPTGYWPTKHAAVREAARLLKSGPNAHLGEKTETRGR